MINILDMNEVERIISEITSAKNLRRKRLEYVSYEVESGVLNKYVAAKIKAMYPESYANYTIAEYSLAHKVVNKKNRAYKEPPIRKLDNDSESQAYNDFLKDNRFNDCMKVVDRIYNQHRYGGVYIEKEELEQKACFYPLRPYEFDVVKNDKGEVICLILSYPGNTVTSGEANKIIAGDRSDDNGGEVEYILWTKENHLVISVTTNSETKNRSIVVKEIEGNPGNINPYGIIPFAYLPFDFNEDYPTASPLANMTVEFNALLSVYLTSANMQVGQLVISGPEDSLPANAVSGMMSVMVIPQSKNMEDKPTTAQYVSPSPDLAGHREAITTYMTMILDEQGISSGQKLGETESFTSGLDRMLSESGLQLIIEDNQDSYTRLEQHIFEIISLMFDGAFKSKFLQIVFKKPKMLSSDADKLANIEKMLELGLIEEWQKFIEVDPNMTEEQAKEKLTRINESKSNQLSTMVSMSVGANGIPPQDAAPSKVKAPTINGKA